VIGHRGAAAQIDGLNVFGLVVVELAGNQRDQIVRGQ